MKKHVLYLIAALLIGALFANAAYAVRWPVDNYKVGGYTFWQKVSSWGYHTGLDITAPAYTVIKAPCAMTIKFKNTITNGGGCILAEAFVNGETVVLEFMHVYTNSVCPWKVGDVVSEGSTLTQTAPSYSTYCGPWMAHLHFGVRRGAYANGTACDGTWKYHGYDKSSSGCDWGNWHNPELFIPFAIKHQKMGGTARVGYAQGNFCWSGSADYRVYKNGSYGECIMVMTPNGVWLVRTGFYLKYMQIGATNSTIGLPTGDEYCYLCTLTCDLARQNFQRGYMIWDCTGSAKVYNRSGTRIAGTEPAIEELAPMKAFSLSIVPNPVRMTADIRFTLPEAVNVTLVVYDVAGRKVATLVSGAQAAGEQVVSWKRTADDGTRVGAGIYFVRLATSKEALNHKVAVID